MINPNPSIADLDAMIAKNAHDDAAIEKIVRGYLRCAIYTYQKHSVTRALRFLQINETGLREELVADFREEGAKYVAEFRDWLVDELSQMGIPAQPTELPN